MSKKANQKLKLLYIKDYLLRNTDQDHGVTLTDIISHLNSCDVSAERKSLYDDIELLRLYGLDICTEKRNRTTYYKVVSRDFEVSELKLLVDSVQGSRFITEKKSTGLIKKLENECSIYEARGLSGQLTVTSRIKSMNECIYLNVDKIHSAIRDNHKISFKYFDYNVKKEKEYRHFGKTYQVSPFALFWDDENYYLIAYDSEYEQIRHYRVDKMDRLTEITTSKREGKKAFEEANFEEYSKKVFSMFGGEQIKVRLEFSNDLSGVIIDRFGKDVFIVPGETDSTFRFDADVVVSPKFFGWLFSFGADAKILGPQNVLDDFKKYIADVSSKYN